MQLVERPRGACCARTGGGGRVEAGRCGGHSPVAAIIIPAAATGPAPLCSAL